MPLSASNTSNEDRRNAQHSLGYIVEVVFRVVAHPRRHAADAYARLRAHVPERPVPGLGPEHPVPDPAELRERDVQHGPRCPPTKALGASGRVDAAVEVVEPGEDRLYHRVAGGGVRAEPVDVGEEEVARVRRGGGEGPDLGENDLRSGLEVRLTVS